MKIRKFNESDDFDLGLLPALKIKTIFEVERYDLEHFIKEVYDKNVYDNDIDNIFISHEDESSILIEIDGYLDEGDKEIAELILAKENIINIVKENGIEFVIDDFLKIILNLSAKNNLIPKGSYTINQYVRRRPMRGAPH